MQYQRMVSVFVGMQLLLAAVLSRGSSKGTGLGLALQGIPDCGVVALLFGERCGAALTGGGLTDWACGSRVPFGGGHGGGLTTRPSRLKVLLASTSLTVCSALRILASRSSCVSCGRREAHAELWEEASDSAGCSSTGASCTLDGGSSSV